MHKELAWFLVKKNKKNLRRKLQEATDKEGLFILKCFKVKWTPS